MITPLRSDIGRATVAINDSTLSAKAAVPAGSWGGTYRVPTGEAVTVYASNSYPVDPALGQRWADTDSNHLTNGVTIRAPLFAGLFPDAPSGDRQARALLDAPAEDALKGKRGCQQKCAMLVSNQRPLACEASALPLS